MSTVIRWIPQSHTREAVASPALDVLDHEDRVEVRVNLPGVAPENVAIEFAKGVLTISAENQTENTEETPSYTRRERYSGSYRRSLRVPDTLNTAEASAHFENGVLYLTLPKQPEAQPLRIPVHLRAN